MRDARRDVDAALLQRYFRYAISPLAMKAA